MSPSRKKVKQRESASNSKVPKRGEDPQSFLKKKPVWSFCRIDNGYDKWGLNTVNNLYDTIISKLRDFEGMTWDEIIKASGGRSQGNNNHFENISSLIPEAQRRWSDIKLDEYDQIFSLRLTGTQRLYGILENGVFQIVWFDPSHEIYCTKKK